MRVVNRPASSEKQGYTYSGRILVGTTTTAHQFMTHFKTAVRKCAGYGLASLVLFTGPIAQSQEMIQRSLLVDMARNQFSVLCQSETFASCMGFTSESCLALAESAIEQCLLPLPEQMEPSELDNSALESCPKSVFADAGFDEEKAGPCFDKAMEGS